MKLILVIWVCNFETNIGDVSLYYWNKYLWNESVILMMRVFIIEINICDMSYYWNWYLWFGSVMLKQIMVSWISGFETNSGYKSLWYWN